MSRKAQHVTPRPCSSPRTPIPEYQTNCTCVPYSQSGQLSEVTSCLWLGIFLELAVLEAVSICHITEHAEDTTNTYTTDGTSPAHPLALPCHSCSSCRHPPISPVITFRLPFICSQPPTPVLPLDLFSAPHSNW
jgi:hypothetical protein